MYSGAEMGRARVRAAWVAMIVCGLAADARADKKKPGLFDIEGWKAPVTRERDFVRSSLAPRGVNLDPAFAPSGEPRVIRVRVYADRDYRGVVLRWQAKVRAQLQHVNAVVGPVFNARFELESAREWDSSHVGRPLDNAMLNELTELDPGEGGRPGHRAGDAAARGGDVGAPHRHRRRICRVTSCCAAWTTSRSSSRSSATSS